jgi:hypothetical protein
MELRFITPAMHEQSQKTHIQFTTNTCEAGVDYGPDYEQDVCELSRYRAEYYVRMGRAVFVEDEPAPAPTRQPAPAPSDQSATPTPQPPRQRG